MNTDIDCSISNDGKNLQRSDIDRSQERRRRKLEKKMRKKELGAGDRDETKWPKCLFWISKCTRFCSGERVPGSNYCINHIHMDPSYESQNHTLQRKRVICPIDPTHTVFEDKLAKHIRVCNKSKQNEHKRQCTYFSENINCGKNILREELSFYTAEEKQLFEEALEKKIRSVYQQLFPEGIPMRVLRPSSFDPFIADKSDRGATQELLRHLYQQVSMISNMDQKHLLNDSYVFVEFGAGRGMLSLGIDFCLNGEVPKESKPSSTDSKGKFLMIDMSPVRFKADRWLRHKESNFCRITGNIRDIHLSKVPIFGYEENKQFVGIAKHLCGVATDYTIRCILNSLQDDLECGGVCIATCCHHRCQWHSFVGQEYYKQLGFEEGEWDYLRRLTSWATNTNGEHSSKEMKEKDDTAKQGNEEMLTHNNVKIEFLKLDPSLGRMCKRIIDYCRSKYIEEQVNRVLKERGRNQQFFSELVYYCEEKDSIENCIILGWLE